MPYHRNGVDGRHGVRNLRFSDVVTDIVYDGEGIIDVKSNAPYTLVVNGKEVRIKAGESKLRM